MPCGKTKKSKKAAGAVKDMALSEAGLSRKQKVKHGIRRRLKSY
jgi:hypothetical protein